MRFPTWRPVGGGLGDKGLGEEEGRGDGVAEVTKQECSRGGQGTGSAGAQPKSCERRDQQQPWPSADDSPPARSQYVNTALFSSVPRLSEEVCSSLVALPHHVLLILFGLTLPLCPLTSLLASPPRQLPPSVCEKHTAKLLKQKTAGFDRII